MNDFLRMNGKDIMNIVNEYKEQFEYLDNLREHKIIFNECLERINVNGVIRDIDNDNFGEFFDWCNFVKWGDYGGSFREFCMGEIDNRIDDFIEEIKEYREENNEEEIDDDDIEEQFCSDVLDDEWTDIENDYDNIIELLNNRGIEDIESINIVREFCIEEGYY